MEPETWAVMAGRGGPSPGAPLNVPPVLASNFELGSGRAYSRDDSTPTWEALEELLGGLEGGQAVAFASGMGAAAAIFDLLPVGATVALDGTGSSDPDGDVLAFNWQFVSRPAGSTATLSAAPTC